MYVAYSEYTKGIQKIHVELKKKKNDKRYKANLTPKGQIRTM